MTATAVTHPLSLQPSWYGTDLSRRSSGQLPFSLAFSSEPHTHRPSSSGSGLGHAHPSATTTLILKDKVPARFLRASLSRPQTPFPEVMNRDPVVLLENVDDQGPPKRTNQVLSTSPQKANKKRTISSSNGDLSPIVIALGMVSAPIVARVNDRAASMPPAEKQRVSIVPEANTEMQDDEKADGFQQKNHFLTKHGMKHHPYPHEAPYMQAYDPVLLENDRFTEVLLRRLNSNGSPTFHDYGSNPPLNVLDLGCGHGRWVVEAATAWKSFGTKVTGFDLVGVSSHSYEADEDSLDNITWVQGNFLKHKLPFSDNTFDLVRMANLSLAIPQDSWLPVFSEVRRILAPGGRLELIDDQILFPYDKSPPKTSLSTRQLSPRSRPSPSSFDSDSAEDMAGTNDASMLVDEPTDLKRPPQTLQEQPFPQVASAEWEAHAENSKGLETIFQSMLLKKYGIHPRPQDIIDIVLSHVFGNKYADQIESMHLALAPADLAVPDRLSMIGSEVRDMSQLIYGEIGDPLMDVEARLEKHTEDDHTKPTRPQRPSHPLLFKHDSISPKAAGLLGIGLPNGTSWEHNRHSQLPENIRARTANVLKRNSAKKWKGRWSEGTTGRRASMESLHLTIPESISPKTAERLDIVPADKSSWESQRPQASRLSEKKRADRSSIPESISPKAAERLGMTPEDRKSWKSQRSQASQSSETKRADHFSVPESISPKAAERLGMTLEDRKSWGSQRSQVSQSSETKRADRSSVPESISPQAAERLGMTPEDRKSWGSQRSQASHSSETKRADRSSGDLRCKEGIIPDPIGVKTTDHLVCNSSVGTGQSPGFILWPSTFIPVNALELEMHACKHMHVLLGCKAALSDFIQDVKGPDGQAHISQNELNDLTWEYECFRRKRFNWPAELPSSHMSIISDATTLKSVPDSRPGRPSISSGVGSTFFGRPKSGSVRSRSSSDYQRNVSTSNDPAVPTYNREDLTFVRVFRVYEAYKPKDG